MKRNFKKSLADVASKELLKEWHPTKNSELTPDDIGVGSKEKVWWMCKKCGESWQAAIATRYHGTGCPFCAGKKVSLSKSLQTQFPEIASEWDSSKNGNVHPSDILPNSSKKFWWICPKGHSYTTQVSSRTRGRGCPICSGNKIILENSLAGVCPELLKEWVWKKNTKFKPDEISPNSHYKAWWKCSKGHEWEAVISNRKNGSGCPFCDGRRVTSAHNLLAKNPSVAAEWHPTKNGNKTPKDYTPSSHHKAWWKCLYGHEWKSSIAHRNNGAGCPFCGGGISAWEARVYAELKTIYPDTIWHTREFKTELDIYIPSILVGIEVDGYNWHKDTLVQDKKKNKKLLKHGVIICRIRQAPLEAVSEWDVLYIGKEPDLEAIKELASKLDLIDKSSKTKKLIKAYLKQKYFADEVSYKKIVSNLPSPPKEASFGSLFPHIAKEWHPTKNYPLTPEHFAPKASKRVWWMCGKGHEWEAAVGTRATGVGCPYCANLLVSKENSLATKFPNLIEEWNTKKNGSLTPDDVVAGSNKKAWWICKKGHEWKASIGARTGPNGTGCPVCSGNKTIKETSLAAIRPEIAAEWHPTKNKDLSPEQISPQTSKKVWWQCLKNPEHVWKTGVSNRFNGNGCPYCSGRKVTKQTSLLALNPELSKQWHPTKNDDLTPEDVRSGANKKVWWICDKGHEWEASINNRSKVNGSGCPFCRGKKASADNNLKLINPSVAREWHPEKNGDKTSSDFLPNSHYKAWWLCANGHEWEAVIARRNRGSGCPYCAGNRKV